MLCFWKVHHHHVVFSESGGVFITLPTIKRTQEICGGSVQVALWRLYVGVEVFLFAGPPEQFDAWLSSFSLEEKKAEISELLVNSPSIRALYTKMVRPASAPSRKAIKMVHSSQQVYY